MSDFRFVIPLKLGDLKNPTNRLDQYVVSLDYTPREISEKLNGTFYILKSLPIKLDFFRMQRKVP